MAIKGVDPKCYILALFVREDGERFLLGSGRYVFKEKQQHFQANKMANDVVEVQGNDGYLLAGQVRRPGTQDFDGYVGDGTSSKAQVEQWRRDFFKFFRKNYLYKVIYVFSDGSAIQRKRGFLVDAPTVEELYQIYPEYHVALNFEDINYYFYNEDSDGHEIYGKSAIIGLTVGATGGLMWDSLGAISLPYSWLNPVSVSGTEIQINNQLSAEVPITDLQPAGDTFQQTYSGKNKLPPTADFSEELNGVTFSGSNGVYTIKGTATAGTTFTNQPFLRGYTVQSGDYLNFCNATTNANSSLRIVFTDNTSSTPSPAPANRNFSLEPFVGKTVQSISWYCANGTAIDMTLSPMITQSSVATVADFEPYVGGTASPNPDYPQDINVVTGEQTVVVTGKNLFDISKVKTNGTVLVNNGDGTITANLSTGANGASPNTLGAFCPSLKVGDTVAMSFVSNGTINYIYLGSPASQAWVKGNTKTITQNMLDAPVYWYGGSGNTSVTYSNFQIEQGSPTPYEPYQSTTKTVDFGSIELAKIGTYQDYIYKSGDDWYVHKATGKVVLDGTETWTATGGGKGYHIDPSDIVLTPANELAPIISNYFTITTFSDIYSARIDYGISNHNNNHWLVLRNKNWSSATDVINWLNTHNTIVYYALATPTETKITDATLIGELEGLEGVKLFIGENNVLVTASSTNLPAPLSFKYYTGINYDGAGFEWEAGGSGGDGMITVDSIDDVYPMLTIPGPVVNPTITNVTTGSVFQYTGTLSSTQTLEVDLMAKTAFLNGVSVIANVTSSSLYFKSGMNRVSYTTNNADAPDATIKWQEIVG